MKVLYLDCPSGISGDMALGALLDLGLDAAQLEARLGMLNVPGWSLRVERRIKNGIEANYARVLLEESSPAHDHSGSHGHPHEHVHSPDHEHGHRSYADIVALIGGAGLPARAQRLALEIFYRVAMAEGKVHGAPPEQVRFHEVGAVDSIVDIVGTALLVDMLDVDAIRCSVVHDGHGFAHCQHGKIPVPVPAVMEIFAAEPQARLQQIDVPHELVTPTGAAIVAALCDAFGPMPQMRITRVGYGAGTRDLSIPNVLRAVLGETLEEEDFSAGAPDTVTVMEANVDDCAAETLGYAMERLLEAGALDVSFTPAQMKKNRPGTRLTVLCAPPLAEAMANILLRETSTLGVRLREERRITLPRRGGIAQTPYGPVSVKIAALPGGGEKAAPEYEEAAALARTHGVPLRAVYEAVKGFDLSV